MLLIFFLNFSCFITYFFVGHIAIQSLILKNIDDFRMYDYISFSDLW